jgi:hypothetical protein
VYLARFEGDDGVIDQGLVTLTALPAATVPAGAAWWDNYVRLVLSANIDSVVLARRLLFGEATGLRQVLIVAAAERRSAELRRFLAPFTRLETFVPGAAELPVTRSEYDAAAGDFPPMRCRIDLSGFSVGRTWLACDFRIARFLDALSTEAAAHGYGLGYQINLRAPMVDRELLRTVRLNALAVRELPGAPAALRERQQMLAEKLARAVAVCEEYVGVEPGEPVAWLCDALSRHFRSSFGHLGFETPVWDFVDNGFDDELACPLPEAATLNDHELTAGALNDEEVAGVLTWRPPATFESSLSDLAGEAEEVATTSGDLPQPYEGSGTYFFVSYKRNDLGLIAPTMHAIQASGWPLWYDRGIPGGTDWNEVLEDRIASCAGLLLFLSQPAVESKYVRREVRLADSLDKPIVVVRMEPAELRHGLRLLLEQYQMLSMAAHDFLDQLDRALARLGGGRKRTAVGRE